MIRWKVKKIFKWSYYGIHGMPEEIHHTKKNLDRQLKRETDILVFKKRFPIKHFPIIGTTFEAYLERLEKGIGF